MDQILNLFRDVQLIDIVDWFVVTMIIYLLLKLFKETRAWPILGGLIVVMIPLIIAPVYKLNTLIWILKGLVPVATTALVVIFQPELRRGLEQIGRGRMFGRASGSAESRGRAVNEVVKSVRTMASTRTGALIVFARETSLTEYVESGIPMDASVSKEVLVNIFTPNTPLHDGAVIIQEEQIKAAACFLPLTDNASIPPTVGTRHRAGMGITEVSDAVVVAVSEETGTISFIVNGRMTRNLDPNELSKLLGQFFVQPRVQNALNFSFRKASK